MVANTAKVGVPTAYTLPSADGSANQVLKTDGSGTLSWTTNSGSGGASSINDLSDALVEGASVWLGTDPSSTTDNAFSNTSVGTSALNNITTGDNNTAVGTKSLNNNTTGSDNSALGYGALGKNTTGGDNVSLGYESLWDNTTGGSNTAVGSRTLNSNTT